MGGDSLLCFSGSAATKYAWVRYKAEAAASNDLRYDMKRVQGTVISGDQLRVDLAQLDALRSRDRSRLATLVSPEKPNGPEIEILVSGMQTIATTLLYTGRIVEGHGFVPMSPELAKERAEKRVKLGYHNLYPALAEK